MDAPDGKHLDTAKCPLCGKPNDCQLCTAASYKGPCWCAKIKFPEELLAKLPPEARNQSCICIHCVTQFHREKTSHLASKKVLPGDFYFDCGLMVFTAAYHLRRGFCCGSGCRHCPYQPKPNLRDNFISRTPPNAP